MFTPSFSFTIPSIHDGSELECRIYISSRLQEPQPTLPSPVRGAIVAHPYAPLGGCYDDPVVKFISDEIYQQGYAVGTFNFRCGTSPDRELTRPLTSLDSGAGGSEGGTSWTAKAELADYVSFYGFMLVYLHHLKRFLSQRQGGNSQTSQNLAVEDAHVHLILGGYSYGSLIASNLPTIDVMIDLFRPGKASPTMSISEISRRAGKIAAATIQQIDPASLKESDTDGIELSTSTSIFYLLVSPLSPPVSTFLTGLSSLSFNVGGLSAQDRPVARPVDQLSMHRTLALYGDQDGFTSVQKLQRWSDELTRVPQSQFQGVLIEGAGHFWREDGVEEQARRALCEWLRG